MGDLLAGRESPLATDVPSRAQIHDIVSDARVWWIRAVGGTNTGGPPTPEAVQSWAEWYPVENSPVLLDEGAELGLMFNRYWGGTGTGGVPSLVIVDPATMKVTAEPDDSLRNLDQIVEMYGR